MKPFLLYPDHDFDFQAKSPSNEEDLIQDLELNTLFNAMAIDDPFLFDVAKKVFLLSTDIDLGAISYRQHVLKDCLRNPSIVKNIYDISVESIEIEKKSYFRIFRKYPAAILSGSIDTLGFYVETLRRLRAIAERHCDTFSSQGFVRLFAMLKKELNEEYFTGVQDHLKKLKFRDGILISAELGKGNKGTNYIIRKPWEQKRGRIQQWVRRLLPRCSRGYTFSIHSRDESGARALTEIRNRGINTVANALAQSADHILSFFVLLRTELAFYIGCLNLHRQLNELGMPVCFPDPEEPSRRKHSFKELYDVSLALTMKQQVIGNDSDADDKELVIITGANQGGKSTFLRSIGLAQLMMQSGMFVPARFFCANICEGLFTHYKREEDATMESGKLDEELARMSTIVNRLRPNSMLLFNESFAATNEREGSEIARQIVRALLEKRIKIFFVTHLYEFAHGLYDKRGTNTMFMRAGRRAGGERTYKIIEGPPLQTSHGVDLYNKIFESSSTPKHLQTTHE